MSDTSLGTTTAPVVPDSFRQKLLRLAVTLLLSTVTLGAAALTTAIIQPRIALPMAAGTIGVCVAAIAVLMLWTIIRAHQLVPGHAQHDPNSRVPGGDGRHAQEQSTSLAVEEGRHLRSAEPDAGVWDALGAADIAQRREMWVTLARRLQSLLHQVIKRLDALENKVEDPELLDDIFKIDNTVTRARRKAENIAVLSGDPPQRQSHTPVELYSALIAAMSEVERFRQILVYPVRGSHAVHGYAAAEIIHLLAELMENATQFADPEGPQVEVRAWMGRSGLAIEIEDRGLGLDDDALFAINGVLNGSSQIDITESLRDGRIGLAVVRELARRNSVRVELRTNIYAGVTAVAVLPHKLLADLTAAPPSVPELVPATPPLTRMAGEPKALMAGAPAPALERRHRAAPGVEAAPAPTAPLSRTRRHALPTRAEETGDINNGSGVAPSPQPLRQSTAVTPHDFPPGEHKPVPSPPPLPQRTGSHMSPHLRAPIQSPTAVPEITPGLFAAVQEGRDHWRTEQAAPTGSDDQPSPHTPSHTDPTGGTTWPRT